MLDPNNIVDFVPIEGNADDFDLGKILESLEKDPPIQPQEAQPIANDAQNTNHAQTSNENVQEGRVPIVNHPDEPQMGITPSQRNVLTNVTNQTLPMQPRMIFNNSSVTINYNFNVFKKK